MKYALLFIVFVPFMSMAQGSETGNGISQKGLKIQYEKMIMWQDYMTISKDSAGSATFHGDEMELDGPVVVNIDSKKQKADKQLSKNWVIVADKVAVTNTANQVSIRADKLAYDNKIQHGVLTGNITMIENGTEKRIGKRAVVDFSNDEYRIVSVR